MPKNLALAILSFVVLVGCDDGNGPAGPDSGITPTYYADVAPLVRRECLGCHVDGGIGPFPLDSYDAVRAEGANVASAVETGYMPPWLPDTECREFAHQRGLTPAERAIFGAWVDGGMLEGDPADLPPGPDPAPPFEATDIARMVEPYTPDPALSDDYHCFILDHEFATDSFVTGRSVVPGARPIVHHVLTYVVPPDLIATFEAVDAAEAGPGYTCFGGPLPEGAGDMTSTLGLTGLGGWVPGQLPFVERAGRGIYVPAGSRIVMQMHYNLLTDVPMPDETEFHMQVTTAEPEFRVSSFPTAILELDIPAGDPAVSFTSVFRNYRSEALTITALTPHMHLLGDQIGMRLMPAIADAAGVPECLIDIPEWDFSWQQSYVLREDDPVVLEVGEGLELTCTYDNSELNQAVVDGMRLPPRDVTWGEGTLDEMCLLFVQHETPWTGPPAQGCDAYATCQASCMAGDAECILGCEGLAGDCRVCALESTLGCARAACLASYAPAATCMQECILSYVLLGGSYERCMQTECPDAWPAVVECVNGVIGAGTCDAQLTACGFPR